MGLFRDFVQNVDFLNESFKEYDHDIGFLYQTTNLPISHIKNEIEINFKPVSFAEIYRSLARSGIRPNRQGQPFREEIKFLWKNGNGGMTLEMISKLTGYNLNRVRNILKNDISDECLESQ